MGSFAYTTIAQPGQRTTIEAPDRAAAIRQLARRGLVPASIEEVRPGGGGGAVGAFVFRRRALGRADMAAFVRELGTALDAGLPLVLALRAMGRQGRGERQRAMIGSLIDRVEHGDSLSDALAGSAGQFPELLVNLVRAGEASGKLPAVLRQAADLMDKDVKLRRSILAATLYPMILGALLIVAVTVVVTVIVPRVMEAIAGQGVALPWPTRVVQGVALFMAHYWWLVGAGVLAGLVLLHRAWREPESRMWIDRRLLAVPVLGRMLRDVAVARFTRTLATLIASGVPTLGALRITKGTLGNRAMERVVEEVIEQVTAGRTIADPMERSGYFPPMLVQIVNLGERSGRLDEMLAQAAGAFEDRTETSVKLFTTALPPILVVVLACVVGFVVLSIMLPLMQMQEVPR